MNTRYDWVIKFLKKDNVKSVIDIGCGLGYGTNLIHKSGFKVVGLDKSENAIYLSLVS